MYVCMHVPVGLHHPLTIFETRSRGPVLGTGSGGVERLQALAWERHVGTPTCYPRVGRGFMGELEPGLSHMLVLGTALFCLTLLVAPARATGLFIPTYSIPTEGGRGSTHSVCRSLDRVCKSFGRESDKHTAR